MRWAPASTPPRSWHQSISPSTLRPCPRSPGRPPLYKGPPRVKRENHWEMVNFNWEHHKTPPWEQAGGKNLRQVSLHPQASKWIHTEINDGRGKRHN